MKLADIDINCWEMAANDRDHRRLTAQRGVRRGEGKCNTQLAEKRDLRKQRSANPATETATSEWGSLATPGYVQHRIDYHGTNHRLARQKDTDECDVV